MNLYITRFSPTRNDLLYDRLKHLGLNENLIIHSYGDVPLNYKSNEKCIKLFRQKNILFKIFNYFIFNFFVLIIFIKFNKRIKNVIYLDLINVPFTIFLPAILKINVILDAHEIFSSVYRSSILYWPSRFIEIIFIRFFKIIIVPSRLRKLYFMISFKLESSKFIVVENISQAKLDLITKIRLNHEKHLDTIYQGSVNSQNCQDIVKAIDYILELGHSVDIQAFGSHLPFLKHVYHKYNSVRFLDPVDTQSALHVLSIYNYCIVVYNKGSVNNELCCPRKYLEAKYLGLKIFCNDLIYFKYSSDPNLILIKS